MMMAAAEEAHYGEHEHREMGQSTIDVRIVAIFTVLVAGLVGGCIPLIVPVFRKANHPATLLLRSLAAGVILSLALIHVIPDGAADLEGLYDGPLASCMVFFGVFAMVMIENLCQDFSVYKLDLGSKPGQFAAPSCSCMATLGDFYSSNTSGVELLKEALIDPGPAPAVTAYMFEFGCVMHSFIIGITLGLMVDDRPQVVTFTIALVFHQLLEAIGLATVIVKARFSFRKSLTMVATFALTVPVSIAIGMGVASSYNAASIGALTTQGVLSSISGGLLLYIALVQMIAQDLAHMTGGLLVRLGMFVVIALGAASMVLIAVYGEDDAHAH
ncbi:hypothetical protein FOA52_005617 [Chlamydomonas sp. UWO 241]|nr:hypothetical protein FOA52_005617 [Chlamydomonas sp. UWO 241]